MNYEKMIAVNRIESEQKIKLATMAIEQLIERGEYPSVTLLAVSYTHLDVYKRQVFR